MHASSSMRAALSRRYACTHLHSQGTIRKQHCRTYCKLSAVNSSEQQQQQRACVRHLRLHCEPCLLYSIYLSYQPCFTTPHAMT